MRPRFVWAVGIALVYFAAIAPLLAWMEFSDGIENLNIETALEMRRGGRWIVPTLMGQPRLRKPPLVAWITASAVEPHTVRAMSSDDSVVRESAWKSLAWQVRWPALLAGALTLALACELGWTLLGKQIGIGSALIAATTVIFLEHSRLAATDVQLALWATLANLCLVKVIFEGKVWSGMIGCGIALGMAFMSKGPVCLVMTLAPVLVFLAWNRIRGGAALCPGVGDVPRWWVFLACAIAAVLMLVIGLSWFVYAAMYYPSQAKIWTMEIFRTDQSEFASSNWFDYIIHFSRFTPWTILLVVGLGQSVEAFWKVNANRLSSEQKARAIRLIYAVMLLVVPIFIMSFFRDRKPRYIYPLAIPAGILVAYTIGEILAQPKHRLGGLLLKAHWASLALLAIGLPIAGTIGAFRWLRLDGSPWFTPKVGIGFSIALAALVVATITISRRIPSFVVPGSALIMVLALTVYVSGNRHSISGSGASEMLPLARYLWTHYPDAVAYDVTSRKRVPPDLAIYLNRPLEVVADVENIPALDNPQVYIALWREDHPEPARVEGWKALIKTPRDRDWWVAFIRDPEQASQLSLRP